jgi:Undecaprenyl-phosphate galactose phosphotransferase WbaP
MARSTQRLESKSTIPNELAIWMPIKSAYDLERISGYLAKLTLMVVDICTIYIALSIAIIVELRLTSSIPMDSQQAPESLQMLVDKPWIVVFACVLCVLYEGLYTKRLHFWQETQYLIRAISLGIVIVFATLAFGDIGNSMTSTVLALTYLLIVVMLPLGRRAVRTVMIYIGIGIEPVIILGAGRTGIMVGNALIDQKHLGYKVAGFLDEDPGKQQQSLLLKGRAVSVLGSFRDTDSVMARTGARHLIVAAPGIPSKMMAGLINRLQREAVSVTVISNLNGVPVMGVEADNTLSDKLLSLHFKNNLARPYNRFLKRSFDIIVGSALLIGLLPILFAIAIAIKINSPGPAIFSHMRVRMHNELFGCYKFRTMFANSKQILEELLAKDEQVREEWERDFKLKKDPRVTPVGRFLRKTSLDELPQILNVIKGEMSLVGPRPVVKQEIERFGYSAAYYFMVRPGITGLWQVSGRNDIDYDERIDLESWYVRNWSLWLDITILIRTVRAVVAKEGAY